MFCGFVAMARIKIIDTFASRMALQCSYRLASLSFHGAVTPSRPCIIMTSPEDKPIQIDLAAIVRQRLGEYYVETVFFG